MNADKIKNIDGKTNNKKKTKKVAFAKDTIIHNKEKE